MALIAPGDEVYHLVRLRGTRLVDDDPEDPRHGARREGPFQ